MWPICRVLPIAPPTDYLRAAPPIDPDKQPVRARSGAALMIEIRRVFEANFCVYGMRKIWRQLAREGIVGARCRVARPCPRPRTGASLGSQLAILSSAVHRAPGRSGHRAVDDSDGNALAETINGLFKAEVIHRRGPWRSFEAVEYATLEWVDWYNHRRLLAPIGNVPLAEAEARDYTHVGDQALAA